MLGSAGPAVQRSRGVLAIVASALLLLVPGSTFAQTFPPLTGRVVDNANIIPPDEEARLTQKLDALETQSQRQLVVVTLPDLQGYDIADYGYQLGRNWGVGGKGRNDGTLLIIAPNNRKLRVEVGYGLEGILTDGLTSLIINQTIVPRFKAGDMPGGIEAGTDALIHQMTLPADEALKVAAQAKQQTSDNGSIAFSTIFWLFLFFLFFVLPMIRRARGGHSCGGSGLGNVIVWSAIDGLTRGGGGSFGGGGSSGSW